MNDFHDDPIVQAAFAEVERQKKLSEEKMQDSQNNDDIMILKDRIAELEFNLTTIREAVASSLEEVLKVEPSFRDVYRKEKITLAQWMNLAKGCKEVLIEFAHKMGKSKSELKSLINSARLDSLNNSFLPINGTNSNSFIAQFENEIKSSIYQSMSSKYSEIKSEIEKGKFFNVGKLHNTWDDQIDEWYDLAKNGNSVAQYNIGAIFYYGVNGLHDIDASIDWLSLSANQKNANACYLLYKIYSDYKHNRFDDDKSDFYFKIVMELDPKLYEKEKNKYQQSKRREKSFRNKLEIAQEEENYFNALSKIYCKRKPSELYRDLLSEAVTNKYVWVQDLLYLLNISFECNSVSKGIFNKEYHEVLEYHNHSKEEIEIQIVTTTISQKSYVKSVIIKPDITGVVAITEPNKNKEEILSVMVSIASNTITQKEFQLIF